MLYSDVPPLSLPLLLFLPPPLPPSPPPLLHLSALLQHTDITTSLSGPNPQQPNNVPPSDSSSSAHHQPLSGPLTHKRKSGQRKTGGVRGSGGDHGEFKRRYKMDQLLGAIKGLQDNNTLLREQAKWVKNGQLLLPRVHSELDHVLARKLKINHGWPGVIAKSWLAWCNS